jgi:hypothetical protein
VSDEAYFTTRGRFVDYKAEAFDETINVMHQKLDAVAALGEEMDGRRPVPNEMEERAHELLKKLDLFRMRLETQIWSRVARLKAEAEHGIS